MLKDLKQEYLQFRLELARANTYRLAAAAMYHHLKLSYERCTKEIIEHDGEPIDFSKRLGPFERAKRLFILTLQTDMKNLVYENGRVRITKPVNFDPQQELNKEEEKELETIKLRGRSVSTK